MLCWVEPSQGEKGCRGKRGLRVGSVAREEVVTVARNSSKSYSLARAHRRVSEASKTQNVLLELLARHLPVRELFSSLNPKSD